MANGNSASREQLSAFMDGELDTGRADDVLKCCHGGGGLADDWDLYHCIGDVLRSSDMATHSGGLASVVGARLASEPHLIAGRRAPVQAVRPKFRGASIAAAAAAVGAVAFLVLPQWTAQREQVAAVPAVAPVASVAGAATVTAPVMAPVSREYLAAHRQYAGGLTMRVNAESGK
jgi:sigma-E factor negative regulatory protein RseA